MTRPFSSEDVAEAFAGFSPPVRPGLLTLRELIFDIADSDPRIGELEESLRWGQPAYLTPKTKSGSTMRLGVSNKGKIAIFVHCRTTLISDFVSVFPSQDDVEGNRAILFESGNSIDPNRHGWLIHRALTYHL